MAERKISTRLAVEGESQYRSAISSCNAELKNMQSALKMTQSQYASNANSSEALTAKQKALNNLLAVQKDKVAQVAAGLKNAQAAEDRYAKKKEELTRKIKENNQALEKLRNSTEDTSEEEDRLTKENEQLNAELLKNEAYLKGAHRAVTNWKTDLNKAKTAVNQTETALDQNSQAMDDNTRKAKENSEALNDLASVLVASGLKRGIREITEALIDCSKASVEFESAMAGVQKTTGMSGTELDSMGEEIKKLSEEIPLSTTELAGIVETAAQLGIAKEDLLSFSETMAALGVSTNMTSEEAATMLARFANVTKMSPDLYENLGSVIVDLGNNFATTEKEIVTMGQRLAAAGELAGLSEPEIMALATAMSSVGIEAEAGGTAMTQTLTALEKAVAGGGDNLKKFAEVAGMSAEQFSTAWQTAPVTAVEAFIEGLGRLDEQGESATLVLDDLGLSGIRQGNMLKSLASASGLLSEAVDTANRAWGDNTALMNEAQTFYGTTESKMNLFKNSVNNLKIAVGDQLNPALDNMLRTGTDAAQWATDFAAANEWLGPTIAAVAAALNVLLGFVTTATVVVPLLKKAWDALSVSFGSSPVGAVATGIAMLTAALVTLSLTLPDPTDKAKKLRDAMDDCSESFEESNLQLEDNIENIDATGNVIDNYVDRLAELNDKTELSAGEQAEYNTIVGRLHELLPNVDLAIDSTTGKLQITTEELRKGAEAWKEYAKQQAFATIFAEQQSSLIELQVALEKGRMELAEYNETATQGSKDYAEALGTEIETRKALADAVEKSGGKETAEVTAAREAANTALEKTGEILAGLTDDEAAAGEAMAELTDSISDAGTKIEEQSKALEKTRDAMEEYEKSLTPAAEKTEEMAKDAEEAKKDLSTMGEGASESMGQLPEATAAAMEETKTAVETGTEEIKTTITTAGTEASEGFGTNLKGMKDEATTAISETLQTISQSSTDAYNAGYGVGGAISQGAAAGVRDNAAQVAEEAAKMVRDAIAAAKAEAKVNSPSKKMIPLGMALDEGVIVGIKRLENDVNKTMANAMEKVVSTKPQISRVSDNTEAALLAINGQRESGLNALAKSLDKKKAPVNVKVNQYIYAEDTSYSGQQKAAAKEMKKISKELNR